MNQTLRNGSLALCLLLLTAPAFAQDEDEPVMGWTGKGEFGLVSTSGNTDTLSINLGLQFIYNSEKWRHTLQAAAVNSEDDDETTAKRYGFGAQSDYKFNERNYAFGALRYENDDFSAYDDQTTLTFGYGHQFMDNDIHKLKAEVGLGYRTATVADTGEEENGAIVRGLVDWIWQLTPSTELTERFLVEAGSDNTYLQNDLAVSVAINEAFAMKAGFQVRHNTDVPPGVDNTDTLTAVSLVYNF